MKKRLLLFISMGVASLATTILAFQWAKPVASAIPDADGYVTIPNTTMPPDKNRTYRAVFDATLPAGKPTELVPALNMAGSELNVLAGSGVPFKNAKFAIAFHGEAVNGILDNDHYQSKFGVPNPNLKTLSALKKAGVEIFVCGQYLAFEKIDPATLSPDVAVATDALIVLMSYQNDGYALLSF